MSHGQASGRDEKLEEAVYGRGGRKSLISRSGEAERSIWVCSAKRHVPSALLCPASSPHECPGGSSPTTDDIAQHGHSRAGRLLRMAGSWVQEGKCPPWVQLGSVT